MEYMVFWQEDIKKQITELSNKLKLDQPSDNNEFVSLIKELLAKLEDQNE